jgi:hypothetical protein
LSLPIAELVFADDPSHPVLLKSSDHVGPGHGLFHGNIVDYPVGPAPALVESELLHGYPKSKLLHGYPESELLQGYPESKLLQGYPASRIFL